MSRLFIAAAFACCIFSADIVEGQLLRRVLGGRPAAPNGVLGGPQMYSPYAAPYGYAPQNYAPQNYAPQNVGQQRILNPQLRIFNGQGIRVQPGAMLQQRFGNGQLAAEVDSRLQILQEQLRQRQGGGETVNQPGLNADLSQQQPAPERYSNPYANRQYSTRQAQAVDIADRQTPSREASSIPTTDLEEIAPPIVPASGTDIFLDEPAGAAPGGTSSIPSEESHSILETPGSGG